AGKLATGLVVPNATAAVNATTAASATALANVTYVESASQTAVNATVAGTPKSSKGTVACPAGTAAIAGGFTTSSTGMEISDSHPDGVTATAPGTGWGRFLAQVQHT